MVLVAVVMCHVPDVHMALGECCSYGRWRHGATMDTGCNGELGAALGSKVVDSGSSNGGSCTHSMHPHLGTLVFVALKHANIFRHKRTRGH